MTAVLTYHHVANPPAGTAKPGLYATPAEFRRQMEWLARRGYETISLDRLRASLLGDAPEPRRAVVLTFDDGYSDNFEHAFPVLREFGFTAAFFIVTGRAGARETSPGGLTERYMDADQIRELRRAGMAIGSHTVSHPWLNRIPIEEARREMAESKAALETLLGEEVRWLCYPSGGFNAAVAAEARALGYAGACSVIRGNRPELRQLYWLPRVMITPGTTPARLRHRLGFLYRFLHARKNRRRWRDFL